MNISELMKQLFTDKDNNGIPDIFEHTMENGETFSMQSSTQKIIVNGKTYNSLDEVPTAEKEKILEVLKRFPNMNTSIFTSTNTKDNITSTAVKPKESKIQFSRVESEKKSYSLFNAKTLNILLLILLAIAIWLIWGRKMG